MKTILYTTIMLFILSSCATQEKKEPERTYYSRETENEFQSIENDRKELLDKYRRLREENWDRYKKRGKNNIRPYQQPRQYSKPRPKKKVIQKSEPEKPPLNAQAIKEMRIEMRQYQDYFCMQQRKSKRFENKADCQAYTENIINGCEEKYPVIRDRKIISCLRAGLN